MIPLTYTTVVNGPLSEEFDEAIAAWKESITLQPSSPDAHTSESLTPLYLEQSLIQIRLGERVYNISYTSGRLSFTSFKASNSRASREILKLICVPSIAASLSPEDPEIAFNLAAVLEASQFALNFRLHYSFIKFRLN